MKTIKAWLATIATLLCSLTASAADFSIGGIFYNIISDTELTVEVTHHGNYSDNYKGAVTIPSAITYRGKVYRVKSIGSYAFYNCPNLTSVVIPEGVTSIGDKAFEYNRNLTSITIPASVTEIGSMAFYDTAWLDKQPDGVVYAGKVLYDYKGTMPRNTSIEIKEGTASIAQGAFSRCSTLVFITIPESVISIGSSAFYNCSSLYEIAIPDGVTEVGYDAFEGSGWYKNQPDGVVYAGKVLYDYKGTMPENTSIEVKKGTTSIAERAFSGCSNLTSIILPDAVTSIGEYAFDGCGSLTSITLPDDVTSIGDYAFDGCTSLISITLPEHLTSIGGSVFYGCSSLSEITIPDGVTEIGWSAFSGCSSLVSINIPSSVTEIGNGAFWNTPWYDNLGDGLVYINNVLHQYKGAMEYNTSIEVREGTVSISPCAFYGSLSNCNSLKSVTIPASVIKIGSQAFDNCRSLRTVNFAENSKLTTIEHGAFLDCWSLTSINIPQSVVSIDNSVFARCSDLANVTLPEDMTVIASSMFADCSKLKAIDIPKNVVCIGDRAFEGCSKLTTITIPNGVTKIRDGAFEDCI